MKKNYSIKTAVWLYPGMAGWHFVTLPKNTSAEMNYHGLTLVVSSSCSRCCESGYRRNQLHPQANAMGFYVGNNRFYLRGYEKRVGINTCFGNRASLAVLKCKMFKWNG